MAGVRLEDLTPSQKIRLGDYTLNVSGIGTRRTRPPAVGGSAQAPVEPAPHGIFIATRTDEMYLDGSGLTVTFTANTPGPPILGLGTVDAGHFLEGRWVPGRALAGDDTGQGNNISLRGGKVTLFCASRIDIAKGRPMRSFRCLIVLVVAGAIGITSGD